MTAPDAARQMCISKARVYELVQRQAIPHYRIGRLVRLRASDVHAYLEANRVEAVDQPSRYASYPAL